MIISNLFSFMNFNYVLTPEIKSKIDFIIRDSENFQPGQFFSKEYKVEYSLLKVDNNDDLKFLKSHNCYFEIFYIKSGIINLKMSNRLISKNLDVKFDDVFYDFFDQENFYLVKDLKKSDIFFLDSIDTYKISSNTSISNLILFKLSKNE